MNPTLRPIVLLLAGLLAAPLFIGCASQRISGAPKDVEKTTSIEVLETLIRNHPNALADSEKDYRIGPGDVVTITLRDHPEDLGPAQNGPQGGFTIGASPMLDLPHIGPIRIHGKTAGELQIDLQRAYDQFFKNPQVSVIIRNYENNQVALLGSVVNPGKFPFDRTDTLQDGIFKAGGIRFFGPNSPAPGRYLKLYREKLSREERSKLSMDELIQRINEGNRLLPRDEFTVPIEDFIISGRLAYNIPLLPNDIIWVPTAGSVIIYGRVTNPGVVFLGPSVRTVAQVLTEARGMRFGARSRVEVVRRNENGGRETFSMDARRILRREEYDFTLQDGDEIWVYTHPGRVTLEFVAELLRRGTSAGVSATYNPAAAVGP